MISFGVRIIEIRMRSLTMIPSKSERDKSKSGIDHATAQSGSGQSRVCASDHPGRCKSGSLGHCMSGNVMHSMLQKKARSGVDGHGARCGKCASNSGSVRRGSIKSDSLKEGSSGHASCGKRWRRVLRSSCTSTSGSVHSGHSHSVKLRSGSTGQSRSGSAMRSRLHRKARFGVDGHGAR